MDRMIGILLRTGVLASAVVTLAGGIWHYAQGGAALPDYRVFRPERAEMHGLGEVLTGIVHGRSQSLIQLGLLMLIATPIARVALSVIAFTLERDRMYVGITLIVLAVLLASLAGFHF
jgi:uncharacterized membrane protein